MNQMQMNQSKVISVWGSGSSGKTTMAIRLAASLAQKNNVLLLFCDSLGTSLSLVAPKEQGRSLGRLLSEANMLTDRLVLKECVPAEKYNRLAYIGYNHKETAYSYPEYFERTVIQLIRCMQDLADYVIVDCQTDIGGDLLSSAALKMSDKVIRVCEASGRSMLYFDSVLPLLEGRIRREDEIKVLNKVRDYQDSDLAAEKYDGVQSVIGYSDMLERHYAEGSFFICESGLDDEIRRIISLIKEENYEEESREVKSLIADTAAGVLRQLKEWRENIIAKRGAKNKKDPDT